MAVYGPGCHPQSSIWTEAKLRGMLWMVCVYGVMGDVVNVMVQCGKLWMVCVYGVMGNVVNGLCVWCNGECCEWFVCMRDVTHKVVYGPKRSWGPNNILWVTDRSILPFGPKCHELFVILYSIHANLSDEGHDWSVLCNGKWGMLWMVCVYGVMGDVVNVMVQCGKLWMVCVYGVMGLYYTQYMQICQTTCFCYCISKTKNEFGQNPEENIILIGPGPYTKILTGQYTKAFRTKWQFMDWFVIHKIVYGPQLRFGLYNILWVTSRSINCHMALSAMHYLINVP
jgi:hypothetical protein